MFCTWKPHWNVKGCRITNNYTFTSFTHTPETKHPHTQRKHTPRDTTDETKGWNDRWTVKTTHTPTPPFHPTHLQPSGSTGGTCWCFLPAHLSATKWLVDWWLMGNGPAACWGMSRWQPDLHSCFDYVSSPAVWCVLDAVLLTSTIELQIKDRQHRFFTMLCIIKGGAASHVQSATLLCVPFSKNFLKQILDKLACCAADCTGRCGECWL